MKWYHWTIYAASLALAFGAGWVVEWYNSPLGEPFCVARGGDLIPRLIAALPAGYAPFWLAAGLPIYGLGLWVAISLHRLAKR